MITNRLEEENVARHKQLSDMKKMKLNLEQKILFYKKKNTEITSLIKKRKEILDIKTGKLEYILEEKEALFNKLHLELAENKILKKKFDSYQKKKKKGFFSSFYNYFQKEDLDNIDVSDGKVKKNILVDTKKNLVENFDKAESYIDNNPEFNTIDFNKIRLDIAENNIMEEIDNLEIKEINENNENNEIKENEEKNENKVKNENKENKVNEDNEENEDNEDSGDEEESDEEEDDGEEDDDNILDSLRKNLDAFPE